MPNFLKGSLIINLILSLCNGIANAYSQSRFKLFVNSVSNCFKNSMPYRLAMRYFNKKDYFEYSLSYRFVMWLVKVLDIPVRAIGRLVKYLIKGSDFIAGANSLVLADVKQRLLCGGVIGIFISLGFTLGILIKGAELNAFVIPGVIALIAILVIICANGLNYIKNSVVYKFIMWFVA